MWLAVVFEAVVWGFGTVPQQNACTHRSPVRPLIKFFLGWWRHGVAFALVFSSRWLLGYGQDKLLAVPADCRETGKRFKSAVPELLEALKGPERVGWGLGGVDGWVLGGVDAGGLGGGGVLNLAGGLSR